MTTATHQVTAPAIANLLETLRERCADMAEGYVYGSAAGRAIRTIEIDTAVRLFLEKTNSRRANDVCLRCGRDGHSSDECRRPVPAWPATGSCT